MLPTDPKHMFYRKVIFLFKLENMVRLYLEPLVALETVNR